MTEEEWRTTGDAEMMLAFLEGKASERKLRLFACACCRRIWGVLPSEVRRAVEAGERYVEGQSTEEEREEALAALWKYRDEQMTVEDIIQNTVTLAAQTTYAAVGAVVDIETLFRGAPGIHWLSDNPASVADDPEAERAAHADLLREMFRNPFRPVTVEGVWLGWGGGTVLHLAEAIYEERAFDRMPILGDALEEAGCTDEDILAHCHGPGTHVRGCWLLDLLLGKA